MPSRFAVVGDFHLEKLKLILPGNTVSLQLRVLAGVFEQCRTLGITTVLQAGDLFDTSQPDDDTKLALASLLLRYPDIHFITIPGNHDRPLMHKHSLKVLGWLGQHRKLSAEVILEPEVREIAGIRTFICPHPFIEDQPKDAQISIGHFAWAGARRDNGSAEPNGSSPKGRWLLGDFHAEQRGTRFEYCGSLMQLHWQESQDKFFKIVQADRAGNVSIVKRRALQLYRLNTLEVKASEDLKAIDRSTKIDYWMLKVHAGVTLPPDWQRQYPRVRRREPFGKAERARANIDRVNLSDDPFEGLGDHLAERKRLTPAQIQWSVNYANTPAP